MGALGGGGAGGGGAGGGGEGGGGEGALTTPSVTTVLGGVTVLTVTPVPANHTLVIVCGSVLATVSTAEPAMTGSLKVA